METLDPGLAALVPSTTHVIRTGAIPARLTKPFGLSSDIGIRGYLHLRAAIAREIAGDRPEVVLITGSPFYPMLTSRWIQRNWNMPVILDFQDPWVSEEGSRRASRSKAGIVHRMAVALEPRAVRAASAITSVSDRQNADMLARYPWLDGVPMAAIPIGGDPDDFGTLALTARNRDAAEEADQITFSYVGTAMPRSSSLFKVLFSALAQLRSELPGLATRLRLQFIGTSNQPNEFRAFRVMPLAEAAGVADLVVERPARVPYLEALRILASSDAVLMIGSDEPHYTASKVYPCLMSGRPFLSLFHRESSAHEIVSRARGGVMLAFETNDELEALVPRLVEGLARLAGEPASVGQVDPSAYAPYTAYESAGRFAAVFEAAASLRRGDRCP